MSALPTNEEEDSDLEIIPNPPPRKGPMIDLSENHNNEKHSQRLSDNQNHDVDTNRNGSNSKKRVIKFKKEPSKKRKLNSKPNTNETKPLRVNVKQKETRDVGSDGFHFFRLSFGLCYAGHCFNRACVAFNEPVMSPRGYGIIHPLLDQQQNKIKCPGCSTQMQPKAIYLYGCSATMDYRFCGDTNTKVEVVSKIPDSQLVHFGSDLYKIANQNDTKPSPTRSIRTAEVNDSAYTFLEFNVFK
eukprot:96399_1